MDRLIVALATGCDSFGTRYGAQWQRGCAACRGV